MAIIDGESGSSVRTKLNTSLALTDAVTATAAELNYTDGVTSAIQTQIDLKAPIASPTFTGVVTLPTPFTLGAVSVLPTGTELNFVDGVTSAIQTQIDSKQATLVSATNIKTINSVSLLGGGDIVIAGAAWGSITGTLTNQTDLDNALALKSPLVSPSFTTPSLGVATATSLTMSGLTAGSVLFAGVGGALSQDNANLFWDDTNNRLGIGTAVPTSTLHIKGSGTSSATTSLLVQNSAGTQLLKVDDGGGQFWGTGEIYISPTSKNTINSAYTTNLDNEDLWLNYRGYNDGVTRFRNTKIGDGKNGLIASFVGNTGNVGIGTSSPNNSSLLDISSTTKGFLPPRMTTTQKNAISSPANGLVVFDTTLNKLAVFTTAWETITSA